jgi:hypothetical protein
MWRRCLVVAAVAVVVGSIVFSPAAALASSAGVNPQCSWNIQIGGSQADATFPDTGARYWGAAFQIPPGGYLEIQGQYPHARYFSFETYTAESQAIDGLYDAQIAPDPGSVNPYVPGAHRDSEHRDYTVYIVNGKVPTSGRAPNTIYTSTTDGSKSEPTGFAQIGYRIYLPDIGRDDTGGVGLPTITSVSSDGSRMLELGGCQIITLPDLGAQQISAALGEGFPISGPGVLGLNPLRWRKYTNPVTAYSAALLDNQLTSSEYQQAASEFDATLPSGGFFENVDTAYLFAVADREFGQVLALRGQVPTTPQTTLGQPIMGNGQMRYWSLCAFSQASSVYGCADDSDIPAKNHHHFLVVLSTAAARPSNASAQCGVNWIPLGAATQTVLLLRNMLPAPSFRDAVQNATVGTEQQTLGPYYPIGSYYHTTADFEKLGCPVNEHTAGAGRTDMRPVDRQPIARPTSTFANRREGTALKR